MNAGAQRRAGALNRSSAGNTANPSGLTIRQRRQIAWLTLGALGVFAFMRWLPTGTNLSHMDFRVDAKNPIDFCDPLNPQFIPVVAVASPVSMTLVANDGAPPIAGEPVHATATLTTASGKPIAPEDLLVVHTERVHLLIADPALQDYQHVHPQPARTPGDWHFTFTPHASGTYRIFADFTPAATNRGLYASVDLAVGAALRRDASAAAGTDRDVKPLLQWTAERDGYRFELKPAALPIRARQPVDLKFFVTRADGGAVPLEPVMGAFAHLVAFDEARSGFAHLHPAQSDTLQRPDAVRPVLDFKITIPQPGRYVIWAQVNLGGQETFVPFWFDVVEGS
jgi:hypothetical protein